MDRARDAGRGTGLGRSAISAVRQIGRSVFGRLADGKIGSVGALSPTVVEFQTTVARKGRRYKNFCDFKLPSSISGDATFNSRGGGRGVWDGVG
ncbi:MAG: hypothetical protein ACK4I8_12130, partial [Armatimonadota bacterium]